jgi:hypothetical protein
MTSLLRNLRLPLCLLAGVPAILVAQGTTSSALMGTIKDPSGKPVAGATIRVSSPALIGVERVTRSTDNGSYRFSMLPPGRYRIVVESPGLTTMTGSEVLELGKSSTLNWKFPAASSATVEVVATAAGGDATPVGLTQNYDTTALANLPVERSMAGIMSLTPGVNGKAAWGGDTGENAWLMDGMNIGDPSGNSQWLYANPDWFSEVQVGGIGAPAEYGNFNGGYVNALVKRGGNEFDGSFNLYLADAKWEAKTSNRYPGLNREIAPGKSFDVALNVGGPIIKDKLWFFASAWQRQEENTPIGALATVKRSYSNLLLKFSWQVLPSATLETLLEYDALPEEHKGLTNDMMPEASRKQIAPDRLFSINWTQTLGANSVFTAKVSGYSGNYEMRPYNGDIPGLSTQDPYNGITYYGNAMNYRNDYRNRLEGTATLDIFKTGLILPGDSHAFKFGFEQAQASDEEINRPNGGVNLYAYEYDPGILVTDYFTTGGGWMIKQRTNRTALYLQDTWTVTDRLTLRPGVRFERYQANGYGRPTLWDRKVIAPRIGGSLALTADQANVLKFHWGKYYAAFNTYFVDRAYRDWIPVQKEYYWGNYDEINPKDRSTWPVADPRTAEQYATVDSYSPLDPNARQPYTVETTFSYLHKFKGPWSVTATWVYRQQKDILVRADLSQILSGPNATGAWVSDVFYDYRHDPEGNTETPFTYWETTTAPDAKQWRIMTAPDAKRNYVSGSIVIERKWMDDWSLNASFTRARRYGNMGSSEGYDSWAPYEDPNYQVNAYGLLPGYNDYEGKIHGVVALPWAIRLSGAFTYLSGERFTPYARTYKDSYGQRSYIFVEARGAEKYPSNRLFDMRLSKDFTFSKKSKLETFVQIFNVMNIGTTLSYASERANSSSYGVPSAVERGRRLQLGVRYSF